MDTFGTLVVSSAVLGLCFVAIALILLGVAMRRGQQDVVSVRDHNNSPVAGIPFYVKRSRAIHETVYLETLGDVTLTLTKLTTRNDQETATIPYAATRTVSLSLEVQQGLARLQAEVAALHSPQSSAWNDDKWASARAAFEKLPPYDGHMPNRRSQILPLISNAVREETYVDYSQRYTLNATMPLIGSNELAAELAADGTLGKATAKAENKMAEILLGALPSADLLKLLKPEKQEEQEKSGESMVSTRVEPDMRYDVQLIIIRHYVRHWLWCVVEDLAYRSPIDQDIEAGKVWYRRETGATPNQPAAPAATDPAPKPEEAKPAGG